MASPTLSLLNLPPELVLVIADHLPPDAVLALKLSHRILYYSLPLSARFKSLPLTHCARLAIRSHLSQPNPKPSHQRCVLCKTVYPLSSFKSSNSPACAPSSLATDAQQPEIVELPHRLCAWHVGRLATIVHTEPGGRNEWISSSEEMCMHCGAIQAWTKCGCACDSCSVQTVTAYTRYLNNQSECRKFVFCREVLDKDLPRPDGVESRLFVRETCYEPTSALSERVVIQKPVLRSERTTPETPTLACTIATYPANITSDMFMSAFGLNVIT